MEKNNQPFIIQFKAVFIQRKLSRKNELCKRLNGVKSAQNVYKFHVVDVSCR